MKALIEKAPSAKLQAPEKLQEPTFEQQKNSKLKIPNSSGLARGSFWAWSLMFLWSLEFGTWSLEDRS